MRSFSKDQGAVLKAGVQQSQVLISNTIFTQNSALSGGIFSSIFQSKVTCVNCTFTNNFGLTAAIIVTSQDGIFELKNSTITENYAMSSLLSEITESSFNSNMSQV